MKCLDNFILSKATCGNEVPTSGLYIESLEGISVSNVAAIEDGKYGSAKNLIQAKVDFAGELIFDRARTKIEDLLIKDDFLAAAEVGVFRPDLGFYDLQAGTAGVKFYKHGSPLSFLRIRRIKALANTSIEGKEITITDGLQTKLVQIDLIAGEPAEIELDFSTQQEWVTITWSLNDIEAAATVLDGSAYSSGCGHCSDNPSVLRASGYLNSGSSSGTYGLVVQATLECDTDAALCRLKDKLKFAILYKTGAEILKEAIASKRVNLFSLNSKEWAADIIPMWEQESESRLESALMNISDYMSRLDKHCFTKNTYRYGYIRP